MGRRVIVSLGSNLGDSRNVLVAAADALRQRFPEGFQVSSIRRTQPVDCPEGSPDFFNAVVLFYVEDSWEPEGLLDWLLELELSFGPRPRLIPNAPRVLGLDLIDFDRVLRSAERLTLPHPRADQRRFVLEPLAEIAPEERLGDNPLSVFEMLNRGV